MIFPEKAKIIVNLDPRGRVAMQRDMELVREILRAIQDKKDLQPEVLDPGQHEEWVFARHVEALYEAGMIDGSISRPMSGPPSVMVRDLTWKGHDFTAILDEETWSKIKKEVPAAKLASMPLEIIKSLAQAVLESVVKKSLGLS